MKKVSKVRKAAIGLLATILAVSLVFAVYYQIKYYPSQVYITGELNLTAYLDGVEWINGTTIDWGNMSIGETKSFAFDVKNTGNIPLTVFLQLENFPPSNLTATCTWTANQTTINPNEWANGTLSLTIDDAIGNQTYTWSNWLCGSPA
jgi:uncharacterized repeat protein (TIGR01451 family)